jgi:hypothetical protein
MLPGKSRAALLVSAVVATLALTGCSGTAASPSATESAAESAPPSAASAAASVAASVAASASASAPASAMSSAPAASGAADQPPAFEIDAVSSPSGMGYSFPQTTAPAGWVTIKLVNQDPQLPHQAQLFRLHDGTDVDAFTKALMTPAGEGAVVPLADPVGGPNAISGSTPATTYVKLDAGATYMVICAIPAPDGKPHYAHGMIGHFSVGQTQSAATEPDAASTITLKNFAFGVPADVDWSKPIDVANQGTEPHELVIVGAASGNTLDGVKAALQAPPGTAPAGPPPYVFLGGVAAIAPGSDQVFQPQVQPGNYLLVCFITDPATGKPHLAHGMTTPITVK